MTVAILEHHETESASTRVRVAMAVDTWIDLQQRDVTLADLAGAFNITLQLAHQAVVDAGWCMSPPAGDTDPHRVFIKSEAA